MRFTRLSDWLGWLETLHPRVMDLGLDRVRPVAARLGVLQPGVPVVTVAGTNGKGSTTAVLEALLRAHGLRTGLYTSPHILNFSERIRIDGAEADEAAIVDALARVDAARGDVSLTYFEFTTLAAFVLFAGAGLDAWVLEIGLGGRLDAVNVVDADVAVLTAVGLDHCEWLGNTRESIAREKAGIFRAGRPAVVGDPMPPSSVDEAIAALGARGLYAGRDFHWRIEDECWHWEGRDRAGETLRFDKLPLPVLAVDNAATALEAFVAMPLRCAVDAGRVARAMATVRLPGRNQRISVRGRPVVFDVGHNGHALAFLRGQLRRHGIGGRFHIVLGMLADKDIEAAVHELEPVCASWHIAPLPPPRGADLGRLRAALQVAVGGRPVTEADSVALALQQALAMPDGIPVLVAGSFHTVGEALQSLGCGRLTDIERGGEWT